MAEYKIKLPSKLDAVRHPKLLALRGVQIGPVFHQTAHDHDLGMHGQTRKKTTTPFRYVRAARKHKEIHTCTTPWHHKEKIKGESLVE